MQLWLYVWHYQNDVFAYECIQFHFSFRCSHRFFLVLFVPNLLKFLLLLLLYLFIIISRFFCASLCEMHNSCNPHCTATVLLSGFLFFLSFLCFMHRYDAKRNKWGEKKSKISLQWARFCVCLCVCIGVYVRFQAEKELKL